MKIGILTYHSPYNFGANLQAFTTCMILKDLGHQPKVIDYKRNESNEIYRKNVPQIQWQAHDNFIETRLPLTSPVENKSDLIEVVKNEKFDLIIVGADAVWSYSSKQTEIPAFFCDWLFETQEISHIPVAAMSVANMSNGFLHLNKEIRDKLKNYISNFSFLSVRDEWTKKVVNEHIFNGEEKIKTINPDPVVCLDKYIKENLDKKNLINDENYIICTFPKKSNKSIKEWFKKFKLIANNEGFLVGELPLPEGSSELEFDFTIPFPIDPIQWYLWIKHSKGFIGVRFHSVVSCFASVVPFYSIDTYGCSKKFLKILSKFKLTSLCDKFDKKSKIYQLLHNTKFRKNRSNIRCFTSINPDFVFKKIYGTNIENIKELQFSLCSEFMNNLNKILETKK